MSNMTDAGSYCDRSATDVWDHQLAGMITFVSAFVSLVVDAGRLSVSHSVSQSINQSVSQFVFRCGNRPTPPPTDGGWVRCALLSHGHSRMYESHAIRILGVSRTVLVRSFTNSGFPLLSVRLIISVLHTNWATRISAEN